MKKKLVIIVLLCGFIGSAQTTIVDSIFTGGVYRTYRLYKPALYNGLTPRPMVINMHGYTSTSFQQQYYTNFMPIADTANFLMVFPQGTKDSNGNTFWNAGVNPSGVNDVAFISNLIDTLSVHFNINSNRIYATGFSMGGFMSHFLAINLNNRIAAIASVAGTFFSLTYPSIPYIATKAVPVMHIHGTSDATVPYAGTSTNSMVSVNTTINYWVTANGCNTVATTSAVPNINTSDGCTADHFLYTGGNLGSTVEHYRVNGGAHTWPGALFSNGITNQDFKASKEIWRFFNKYTLMLPTKIDENNNLNNSISIFPNPVQSFLNFKVNGYENSLVVNIKIVDMFGNTVLNEDTDGNFISVDKIKNGIYLLQIKLANNQIVTKKIIKE